VNLEVPFEDTLFLESKILEVQDYPKPGVIFKDVTPLLANAQALSLTVELMADFFEEQEATVIAGIEARGFILGAAVAAELEIGFVPLRKPGKSPRRVFSISYDLEYGSDELQVHHDLIQENDRVGIIDDVLATGGTALASAELVEMAGGQLAGFAVLLELSFLSGRQRVIDKYPNLPMQALVIH
jgi:adenine phosphoribosyltransferase